MTVEQVFRAIALTVVAGLCGLASGMVHAQAPRPNIVYIVADDQGFADVGFRGSSIRTPNIDQLAQGGARFDQFYAYPFCTQARAALLTGRYTHRYGLQTVVILSNGKYGLATDEWILPQALKEAGYTTAMVGKWHLGHADRKYWPLQRGFDLQYGPLLGEIDYFTHSAHGTRDWFRQERPLKEKGYVTELLGREAVRIVERHDKSKPLFMYLAFTAPHAPYQAPQAYLDRYRDVADPSRRAYAAMISAMDDQIGAVIKALERRGMRDNTLIVYQSDNGGPVSAQFTGEVDMSKATIPASNAPYRDGKGMLYEGGTRVVALANWPGHIPAGTVVDQPMQIVDMYPTLAAVAGASTAKTKPLDGMNMWATIAEGKPSPRDVVVYAIEPFRAAVRKGDWKLVWRASLPSSVELFNLAQDPAEKNNLAGTNAAKVAELQQLAEAQAREAVPPLFLLEAMGVVKQVQMGAVALPLDTKGEMKALEMEP